MRKTKKGADFLLPFFLHDMKKTIYIKIADIPFKLELWHPNLEHNYQDYLVPPQEDAIEIAVGEERLSACPEENQAIAELYEQSLLMGDALPQFDKLLFHGCAFLWRDKAWIFAAPSGTGKTTQYVLWKMQYPEEITMINGDKPILEFRTDSIMLHPSPWRGKENMGVQRSAPLGGIIYLRQDEENRVERLSAKEAVQPIFGQILFSADDVQTIKAVAKLEERLLNCVPVWQLRNRGDSESAILCHDTLRREEDGE